MSERISDSEHGKASNDRARHGQRLCRIAVFFVSLLLAFTALSCLGPGNVSADERTFWIDNFDAGWQWTTRDLTDTYGVDTWGLYPHFGASGAEDPCAWCAADGVQGTDGQANIEVMQYDRYMDAQMEISLPSLTGYSSVLLVFYFKIDTSFDDPAWYEEPDELRLWVFDGSWVEVWSDSGFVSVWTYANYVLPTTATKIIFEFHSNSDSVSADGAWIDGVRLDGTDTLAPTSHVDDLPSSTTTAVVDIPYTATDTGSGVQYVELWYMKAGAGAYSKYTYGSPGGTGRWTSSPISFDSDAPGVGGPGIYYFYTIAVDNHDNSEALPSGGYDESMSINTIVPEFSGLMILIMAIVPATMILARRLAERGGRRRP